MNGLSEDSIFGQVFGFLGKMIALNILSWIVTSLPHSDNRGLDHGHVLHGA